VRSREKTFLILVLVGAFVIRLFSLNQSLWLDEATSVLAAKNFSFPDLIFKFSPGDFHPPLYYLVLKMWISFFGTSEIAVRVLSVISGVATVYIVYLIGKKLSGSGVAVTAAAFLATAPLHIYYSQEARMYSLETLLAVLVVWFFVSEKWIGLVITAAILLYTDYLPALILIPLFLIKKKKLVLPFIGVLLLLLPWFPIFLNQLQNGLAVHSNAPNWWVTLGKTNFKELALVPVKFMLGRISFYNKSLYAATVLGSGAIFGTALFGTLRKWQKARPLWLLFLFPILAAAALGLYISVFSYFRLLFVLPLFYLLVAYGTQNLGARWFKPLLAGILFINLTASSLYLFTPRFHREDWKSAVSWLEQDAGQKSAATLFVTNNQRDPYIYYSKGVPSFGPDGLGRGNFEKIYLMRYVQPIFDPQDSLRKKIESVGYQRMAEKDFNGVTVWAYERNTYANLH